MNNIAATMAEARGLSLNAWAAEALASFFRNISSETLHISIDIKI